ncbi:GNAT family N-acetyltransferase [Actinotalea sp. Marseille-Q4924]|uniref:GNAT family N-acetyltransferase n=1 Tax=Actinotalea sp. Marseille-Q4924 TaxID=2866571 RepID=UPI001CE42E9D|nr:GNAT family N-acetyltransferase [Actinotalea sp. Marseille-Q4924]
MSERTGEARTVPALRPLTEEDLPRLVELEERLFAPSAWSAGMLTEELRAPGRWYVGIDADASPGPVGGTSSDGAARGRSSRLVAYAGLWFDGDVGQVMTLGVDPAAQRRGLGTILLHALVGRARELGAEAVLLEVRVDNAPAIALYRGHGFEVLGRRRRYYQPEGVDAFTMRLPLR